MPNISLGTVYRNLRFLVEMGEIMELNYTNSYSRFDGNPSNHYHFVCQTCGEVSDLELTSHPDIDVLIKDKDLVVFSHRLEFYGLCSKCQSD